MLTLATKGNEMKQSIVESQSSAKSEGRKLRVPKIKQELPLLQRKSQPGCPLGLPYWQKKKVQKLSAQELEKMNMAWVPKGSTKKE